MSNTVSDRGWAFPPEFQNNGKDVQQVADEVDIKQSLEILFSTTLGERFEYPDFGCDLGKFVFEEVNNSLVIEIEDMIYNAIYSYEPRIEIDSIEISESDNQAHVLLINLNYIISETSEEQNLEYSFSIY